MVQFAKSLALTLASSLVSAAAVKRSPKYVSLDFNVHTVSTKNATIAKRGDEPVTVDRSTGIYLITLYVGSEGEASLLLLDTGSSDLWLKDKSAGGNYDSGDSTTYKATSSTFQDDYVSGDVAGVWAYEQFALSSGGTPVTSYYFGDATAVPTGMDFDGLVGVGLEGLESTEEESGYTYSNFPEALKDQGFIDKNAFSLYLNSEDATTGTILFGAIDQAKYTGSLVEFDLPSSNDEEDDYNRYAVEVENIVFNGNTYSAGELFTLDSGTTITYVPQDVYDAVAGYFTSCDQSSDSEYIDFDFGSITISVPYSDVVYTVDDQCELGIAPNTDADGYYILGQNFLRHTYVVFDPEDRKVSLAKVKYTTDSDIVSF